MIVDYILDRKADEDNGIYDFDARDFYNYVSEESEIFGFTNVARALDTGTENDVKKRLCEYIDNGDYNPAIKDYINSKMWTISDSELDRYNRLHEEVNKIVNNLWEDPEWRAYWGVDGDYYGEDTEDPEDYV